MLSTMLCQLDKRANKAHNGLVRDAPFCATPTSGFHSGSDSARGLLYNYLASMQILVNGLISGFTLALLALGFAVVYVPTRVFHLALGAVYALAPFIVWEGLARGLSLWASIALAFIVTMAVSWGCERLNHWPLTRKGASSEVQMISALGIYIVLVQLIALQWSNSTKTLRQGLDMTFATNGIVLTQSQVVAASVSLLAFTMFFLLLRYSKYGLNLKALAENPTEFALRGHNVQRVRAMAFALSGFLAATSSLLVANDVGFTPNTGLTTLLIAMVAAIIGGRLSFAGAVLGGLLVGLIRAGTEWLFSANWSDGVVFLLLALFLLLRPNGILASRKRVEAAT